MKYIGVAECHWVGEDRRKRKRLNGEEGMGEMSTDQPKTNRWGKDREGKKKAEICNRSLPPDQTIAYLEI